MNLSNRFTKALIAVACSSALLGCAGTGVSQPGQTTASVQCQKLGASVEEHWVSRTTLPILDTSMTTDESLCVRDEFLKHLQTRIGRPLGYKAAAITPPAQRDLGISEPMGGVYLAGMFRYADGPLTRVPVSYGARPIVEAKLMVTVKDVKINDAKTIEEAARSIAYVIPSIELGDSLVDANQKLTAPILNVYNVGARGVLHGEAIPFDGSAQSIAALASLVVTTRDENGRQVDRQTGSVIMGNPLNAVLWIVRDVNSRGVRLQPGDRLGLGAMSRVRPKVGTLVDTRWAGLSTTETRLAVQFE